MKTLSYKFELSNINKDGVGALFLRIIIARKKKRYNLKMKFLANLWDAGKQRIKSRQKEHQDLNLILDQYESKIKQIDIDLRLKGESITFEIFEDLFFSIKVLTDFVDYAENFIKRKNDIYSHGTIRTYKVQINRIKEYKPKLDIRDVNLMFLEDYYSFLVRKGLHINTVNKSMAFIKG